MPKPKMVLSPQDVKAIEAMSGYGMTQVQIAHVLGMSLITFQRRLKDTPIEMGVIDACQRGKAVAVSNVSKRAYEIAKAGNNPNFTLSWLKCQSGWKETQSVEMSGKDGKPLPESAPKVIVILPDNGRDRT